MPIYEYECSRCAMRFERLIRSQGDLPKTCPDCGSRRIGKVFSAFSVAAPAPAGAACGSCETAAACPMSRRGGCPGGSCGL